MQLPKRVFILQINEDRFQGEEIVYISYKSGIYLLIFKKIL